MHHASDACKICTRMIHVHVQKWELLITMEFEANVCPNNVPWTTTKIKLSFCTNRHANIAGLFLESRTSRRSVEVFAGNSHYSAHEVVELLLREDHRTVERRR